MTDFAGAKKIGFLLGGGAGQIKRQGYNDGRLNTAKTEEALENARLKKLEAQAKATKIREAEKFEEVYVAGGGDPKQAALIGNLIRSEGGSDFYSAQQGLGEEQDRGFRDILAGDESTPEQRLHAGFGIQGKVSPDIAPVGTHGTVNLTDEDQTLVASPGSKTTAARNYEYSLNLPNDEARIDFSPFVGADQIVDAGGVRLAKPRTGGAATPVATPEDVANNAAKIAEGKRTGTERAKLAAEYPRAVFARDRTKQDIRAMNDQAQQIAANEKLYQAFGLTKPIASIAGTEGANLRAMVQTLTSKMMINTLLNLRAMSKTGGAVGNVSDREGLKMETAIANLSDPNISVGQVLKEVKRLISYNTELESSIDNAFRRTYDPQGNPILGARPSTDAPADGEGPTIEEIIINEGLGEYNENGDLVNERGWILMKDAAGNAAWVNPDGSGDFEGVAQ